MVYETDEEERLLTGHTGRLFFVLTIALVCLQLSQRLLPPLLPEIIDELGITAFLAGVALTVMRVARAGMEYPSGRFADQLSRTTVLLVSLGLVVCGVAVLSVSVSYGIFLVGVTVFGMGLGLYNPAARALLSDIFVEKRGRAFGFHMMGSDVSGIVAAAVAIWVATVTTWRGAFLPLLLVLLPFPFVLAYLSREGNELAWVDLGLLETGSRLFGHSTIRWVLVVYSLFILASSGVTSFLPTFLIETYEFSFAFASSAFALVYAVGVVAKPLGGVASDRISRPVVAGGGLTLAAGGLVVVVFAPSQELAIVGVVVHSIGQRGMPPALQAYLMDHFPDDSRGGDFGGVRAIYQTVGSLGPGFTGLVISVAGFDVAYLALVALFLLGAAPLLYASAFN